MPWNLFVVGYNLVTNKGHISATQIAVQPRHHGLRERQIIARIGWEALGR